MNFSTIPNSRKLKENKMTKENCTKIILLKWKRKKKCTRVFNHPEILESPKTAHIALEARIYRLSTVGPHFINCIVDPQNYGPNWSLCRKIESSVATEPPVFVASSVLASRFSVTTFSLGLFLISFATYFVDVMT